MFNLFVFPLLLVLLSAGLIYWNVRSWRLAQRVGDADEVAFARRQFRRRVQASAMLGVVAVALCAGQLIPGATYPNVFIFFWLGVVLLVLWAVLLALGDMAVNRQRLQRFQLQRRIEEAKLKAELERLRSRPAAERKAAADEGHP